MYPARGKKKSRNVYRGQKVLRNSVGRNSARVYITTCVSHRYPLLRCQAATSNSEIFPLCSEGYAHGCLTIEKEGCNQDHYKVVHYQIWSDEDDGIEVVDEGPYLCI